MTFEIVPDEPRKRLPDELREIEGGRLTIEEVLGSGQRYKKATVVLPLPNGDTRERVLFFAEEENSIRMLGFHRIHRHLESPQGETVVFDSGKANPLAGRIVRVPADTYTLLALCVALGGDPGARTPLRTNLWLSESEIVPVEIAVEGSEEIAVLGTKVASRRIHVKPEAGGSWVALYWMTDSPPHTFLQYRGPANVLVDAGARVTLLRLRTTSSSEQVRKALSQ